MSGSFIDLWRRVPIPEVSRTHAHRSGLLIRSTVRYGRALKDPDRAARRLGAWFDGLGRGWPNSTAAWPLRSGQGALVLYPRLPRRDLFVVRVSVQGSASVGPFLFVAAHVPSLPSLAEYDVIPHAIPPSSPAFR